ncbi:uroporphyrinogen-III C-methyltransferase [Thalassobacillus sp. C254]|uniref:uroporphyrinogen-III C-methyltransferase n=1 Tax=Thalassobacillus sp. C254 TaxID=1225341 RepID=UPI000A79A572|nr:uroporphyrinogen-III C-methyltransferase [Thalassobacillus sp. C254]
MGVGTVYLVGAGPGDSKLITVRGFEYLRTADVVLYDRLVNPLLLDEAKPKAELIYCGKLPDRHHLRQEAIQEVMIEKAKEGLHVIRLKGGDPGVFGRVGEEAAALAKAEVPYEIIPGITAGIAAPAYAGVPVTHREHASSFAIVTGHAQTGEPSPNWEGLATSIDTIAFYMGVKNLSFIAENLIKHGKSKDTPIMLVEWATTSRQRTVEGTLENITEVVERENIKNPALTLVGDVVGLRKSLHWFEKKKLTDQTILVGQTNSKKSSIAAKLRENGAEAFEFPSFRETPESESFPENLKSFSKIVFLASESVTPFFKEIKRRRIDVRSLPSEITATTKRGAVYLEEHGIFSEIDSFIQEEEGVLYIGKEDQIAPLSEDGWISHRAVTNEKSNITLVRLHQDKRLTTVVFPCAESVETVTREVEEAGISFKEWKEDKLFICYGPKSRMKAEETGYENCIELEQPDVDHLIASLAATQITYS